MTIQVNLMPNHSETWRRQHKSAELLLFPVSLPCITAVFETDLIKVYWDKAVQVVGHCPSDFPYVESDKCVYLIDVSIPSDSNLHSNFCEKYNT